MVTATTEKIRRRRANLVKRFNDGNWRKYLKMFADDATMHDPDRSFPITGAKNLGAYFKVLFEFAEERSFPPMQLKSKQMVLKRKFVYDIGEYRWSTHQCGRYFHTWTLIKGEYYLISDRFTVDEYPVNDENMNICI